MKVSYMNGKSATRKILTMDYPASPSRPRNTQGAWHSESSKGLYNILYGDNHVEGYVFKPTERTVAQGGTVAQDEPGDLTKRNYW
jgi:hypothetical protein